MRESGILMHISSLPGPYGIGSIGTPSFAFVDFLQEAGQRCWQILPLSPTGYGDSPYQSCSAFAGNHYLIDLDALVQDGLLLQSEIDAVDWCIREDTVDYGILYHSRLTLLRLAYGRFAGSQDFDRFCRESSSWLPDFALYMALKDRFDGQSWDQWPLPLKLRQSDAVWQARQELKHEIRFYSFVQFLFFHQWELLRAYAHQKGIRIIGDVPIYVPYDSCDVWSNPELFQLDANLNPSMVAGVPPDGFTADGQLWGNPLYQWDRHQADGYAWWINRLAAAGRLYDVIRLDHFRGFESYWAVPYGEQTARNGHWVKGPGISFVQTVNRQLPQLSILAEDLGYLTPEVLKLRQTSGYPGMKILEFAFDSRTPSDYLPHTYTHNTVCYTGTHDNMTCRQWFDTAAAEALDYAAEYMHLTQKEGYVWGMIRTAFASVADLCIIQMQDYLELGAEARMNCPGTLSGKNWTWRACAGFDTSALARKIRRMTALYCRTGNENA